MGVGSNSFFKKSCRVTRLLKKRDSRSRKYTFVGSRIDQKKDNSGKFFIDDFVVGWRASVERNQGLLTWRRPFFSIRRGGLECCDLRGSPFA